MEVAFSRSRHAIATLTACQSQAAVHLGFGVGDPAPQVRMQRSSFGGYLESWVVDKDQLQVFFGTQIDISYVLILVCIFFAEESVI